MKKAAWIIPALCLLLSGCTAWMDGNYRNKTPYQEQGYRQENQIVSVSDFLELRQALTDMVESGVESGTISVERMDEASVQNHMTVAIRHILTSNPIGAYAVERITYEQGTSGGTSAVAVTVTYNSRHSQIRRIPTCQGMEAAQSRITAALDSCKDSLVLRVEDYSDWDIPQMIRRYADENPQKVMEQPQVTVNTYPESGNSRVVELQFDYQTDRDTLRSMQEYVAPVFTAATMYVRGDTEPAVKYAQLYAFLMERYQYSIQTSITPAYSLLRYGVGDSKAFAHVYAAMCRNASLECMVVSGTYQAEARLWNIICVDGVYYHVDLLACNEQGGYTVATDAQMVDYVWDYSAYPQCGLPET